MDPVTAAAFINAGSNVLGSALKQPPNYSSAATNSWFDSSGWTVATGGSRAQGGARSQTDFGQLMPLLVAAAVVGLLIWKKHK